MKTTQPKVSASKWGGRVATALVSDSRPRPPQAVGAQEPDAFMPAPDVLAWVRRTFLHDGSVLHNAEHAHLTHAQLGVVWTNVSYQRGGRTVVGFAETPQSQGGAWKAGRQDQQLRDWFGYDPDFIITLHAPSMAEMDDRGFCAVLEHELYHCAQQQDRFGGLKFRESGQPAFCIRGHDIEEFIGVVARYGAIGEVRSLVHAAQHAPLIADDRVRTACGNCLARVA